MATIEKNGKTLEVNDDGFLLKPEEWDRSVALILAGSIVAMHRLVDRSNLVAWLIWAVVIAAMTYGFVQLSRRRTDGEWKWRWGADKKH